MVESEIILLSQALALMASERERNDIALAECVQRSKVNASRSHKNIYSRLNRDKGAKIPVIYGTPSLGLRWPVD